MFNQFMDRFSAVSMLLTRALVWVLVTPVVAFISLVSAIREVMKLLRKGWD